MALHKDKFEYMCHRHNRRSALVELPFVSELYQYSVSNDKSLAPVGQLRDLGVLVSNDLSWQPHIKTIANKARQKAAWVFSVFQTRSTVIMLTLYKSMVRSLLEYCCPLWHPSKICDIQELESVQKAFTARITGMRDLHYWDRPLLGPSSTAISDVSTATQGTVHFTSYVEDSPSPYQQRH